MLWTLLSLWHHRPALTNKQYTLLYLTNINVFNKNRNITCNKTSYRKFSSGLNTPNFFISQTLTITNPYTTPHFNQSGCLNYWGSGVYDYELSNKKGSENVAVDALSRASLYLNFSISIPLCKQMISFWYPKQTV